MPIGDQADVASRLARLEALEAARALLARYARACDASDLAAVTALFSPRCRLEVAGRSWSGVDEIAGFFRQAWSEDPTRKRHFITNIEALEWDGAKVTVEAYFLYTAAGDSSSILGWGEYLDVIDTTGTGPLFEEKSMRVVRAADVREGWALSGSEQ